MWQIASNPPQPPQKNPEKKGKKSGGVAENGRWRLLANPAWVPLGCRLDAAGMPSGPHGIPFGSRSGLRRRGGRLVDAIGFGEVRRPEIASFLDGQARFEEGHRQILEAA